MMNWLRRNVEPARDRVEPVIGNMADVGDVVVSSDREGMLRLFMDMPTDAGAVVTSATAMRVSAVYACVRLIAGAIGSLPVDIYKRDADGNSMPLHNHDLWWLFNESASLFRYSLSVLLQICFISSICRKPRAICSTSRGLIFFSGILLTSRSISPHCFIC